MDINHQEIAATATNTVVAIPFQATNLLIRNLSTTDDCWINVSGTGVAVASGPLNIRVRFGESLTLVAGRGETITAIGVIYAATKNGTVLLTASLA